MTSYTWADAAQVTVHAMADGEWGGVQFRAQSAGAQPGTINPMVNFSHGGYQQARGATLSRGNRFYMEGSREFVDAPGEWHFNPTTRELVVFPPSGVSLDQGQVHPTDPVPRVTPCTLSELHCHCHACSSPYALIRT